MDIESNWEAIRKHFNKSFSSNFHVSLATVDAENNPTVTPIGTLFLNDDLTGFYFEKFPTKIPKHIKNNPTICLLGVNSGRIFWLKALSQGKFKAYPAIKLYGKLGEKRKATQSEIKRLNRRMKVTNGLKGNTYLWKDMKFVREVRFNKAEKVNLGNMTSEL